MEATNPTSGKIATFFQSALDKARQILKDPERMENLVKKTREKINLLRNESKELDLLLTKLSTSLRMIRAFKNKTYTAIPWKSILMITAGVIYFVMPVDLVPDFIPVLGLLDDASVMLWIFKFLRKDIEAFEAWEQKHVAKS